MEIKTEADSDDMTECLRYDPHDDRPTTGMFGSSDSTLCGCRQDLTAKVIS